MRLKLALATLMLLLCVVPARSDDACQHLRDIPPHCMGYRIHGGIDGRDLWVVLWPDGHVCHVINKHIQRGTLSASRQAALRQAFDSSGFFGWEERYGTGVTADGLERTLFFDDGQRAHRVTWSDPGTPPAGFDALVKQIDSLVR